MNYYRFPDNKISRIGFILVLTALQLVARSTMITSSILGFYKGQAVMLGLVFLTGIVFLIFNRKNLKQILTDRRMAVVILVTVVMIGPMLLKQDWQLMYFSVLLCLYFSVFLTYFITLEEVSRHYILILSVLSVYALIGQFVLKPLANAGMIPAREMLSTGGWHMYNFGLTFAADMNIYLQDTSRVFGFFREPGLYQVFLFIAIQLNNYTVQWDKPWKMWVFNAILGLTLLTTFATGGVLAMGLYIVFLFFDKKFYKDKRICILALICVLLATGALVYALMQDGTWAIELIWMVQKIFEKSNSYVDRIDAVISNANYFLQNPLVGGNMWEIMNSVMNNTTTSAIIFAVYGIFGGCLHVISWVALAWKKERSVLMNLILMLILFVPFNTQCVNADMFFWLFPTMALVEKGVPFMETLIRRKRG